MRKNDAGRASKQNVLDVDHHYCIRLKLNATESIERLKSTACSKLYMNRNRTGTADCQMRPTT
jgi:hypothetical protein